MNYLRRLAFAKHKYAAEFHATFGVEIDRFWDVFTGFDVIAYDQWLGTPDGISCSDYTIQRYGNDADRLITTLIEPTKNK